MKPYVPQPGTIPHRAIEHLKTLPTGAELSTAVLADAIGQPRGILAACLNTPRKHGVLASRQEAGLMYWSLGDGTPARPPADLVPDEPLHPMPKVPTKPASLFDLREPRPMKPRQAAPMPAPHAAPMPEPTPPTAASRAKFGVYSDNTFCIQRGTDAIWLDPEEFRELAEFIAKSRAQ